MKIKSENIQQTIYVECECGIRRESGCFTKMGFADVLNYDGWRVVDGNVLCPICVRNGVGL